MKWGALSALPLFAALVGPAAHSLSSGPPAGAAGVPAGGSYSAEMTCANVGCHDSFEANADDKGRIELAGVPSAYEPGQPYLLTFTLRHPTARRWGFQLTAVTVGTMRPAGDFAALPNDKTTQRITGGEAGRVYIEQGGAGRLATGIDQPNAFSWRFYWIAPKEDRGEVDFFGSGNAANGDGSPGGDFIYSTHAPLASTTLARMGTASSDRLIRLLAKTLDGARPNHD